MCLFTHGDFQLYAKTKHTEFISALFVLKKGRRKKKQNEHMQSSHWEERKRVILLSWRFTRFAKNSNLMQKKNACIFATIFIFTFHLKIAQIIWWLYCGSIKNMHWIYRCYSTSLAMLCHIYCNSCNFRCIKRSLAQTPIPHLHLKCVCLFLFHWILSVYP